MNNKYLRHPFEVYVSDMNRWNERPLIYHFFEIVLILEGEGSRIVNENNFTYSAGSIFLFTPLDCRGFESYSSTKYCSIRFLDVFLSEYKNSDEKVRTIEWLKKLEYIFSHHNRFQEFLLKEPEDSKLISSLIEGLILEYNLKRHNYQNNIQHFLTIILNILARNVSVEKFKHADDLKEPLINKIMDHIRLNIDCPKQLRVQYLASKFNISPNYVGEYFKRLTGATLLSYILAYRINLIKQRLLNSDLTIKEIADELGFTDESHLSKHFKRNYGCTPSQYRKIQLAHVNEELTS